MKIRTLLACLAVAVCAASPVSAQICANTVAGANSIAVSGNVTGEEVQILLLKPGFEISDAESAVASEDKSQMGNVIEYFGQATVTGGKLEAAIPMRTDAEKGKYLLAVDNETCFVYYADSQDMADMTAAARTALSGGSFSAFAANEGRYFCNADLYDKLSSGVKAAGYAAQMLSGYNNPNDAEFVEKMTAALNMGIVMEALNENTVTDFSILTEMTDPSEMKVPIDKAYLVKEDKIRTIIADISGRNFTSPGEYTKALSESIFVNVINNAANMLNSEKKEFFETYAAALGLNLSDYNTLTENKRLEVIAKVAAENKGTLQLLQSALNSACKNSTPSASTPKTTTGGGGGGGGTGIRPVPATTATPDSGDGNQKSGLYDLEQCKWAQPAIEHLISLKMISGYDDNTFKPFNNISRAEFVTIIARKYLPSDSYAQSFSDVMRDKWYFGYVESAYNSGIISGVGDGVFAPDANISRQDMAVILFRLASFAGHELSGEAEEFADDESIASYAKNAVYSLRGAGIISGDENGSFNPNAAATRAEAAQMIYNLVNFLE